MLDTSGQEVLAVFIRKAILFNSSAIFGQDHRYKHGTYSLLQDKVEELRRDPTKAFQIVDAVDAAKEETFKTFDVVKFVTHFLSDPSSQLVLGVAFTASARRSIHLQAQQLVSELLQPFGAPTQPVDLQLEGLAPTTVACLSSILALAPGIIEPKRHALQQTFASVAGSENTAQASDIMSTLQLWKLPDRDRSIIDAFKKAGPRSASTRHSIEDVVSSLPPAASSPAEVANALLFMLFAQPNQHYNLPEFVSVLKSSPRFRPLNWNLVVRSFDVPDMRIHVDHFSRLFHALRQIAADDHEFDLQGLWAGTWDNPKTQISFLRSFFDMQDVSPNTIPGFRPAFQASEFEKASPQVQQRVRTELESHHTNFYALKAVFDVILASDSMSDEEDSNVILHNLVRNTLFGFLLSLVHIAPNDGWTQTQETFLNSCFRTYLEDREPDSDLALETLFHQDQRMVNNLCTVTFHNDPRQTAIIARKAQLLGWTDFLLESFQTPLALDIACLLQKEGSNFDLEEWISRAVASLSSKSERMAVGNTLWKFLRIKADDEYRHQKDNTDYQSISLSLPAVYILLWKVQELLEDRDQVKAAQCTCLTTYPRLMNYGGGFDSILEQASREKGNKLSPETDERMSDLFGRMYRNEVQIGEMINEMRRYKTSTNSQMQDLFCCIVHGLFDEYGCYGEYPQDALMRTALLFGNIIRFRLLPPIPEAYGLTLIVDAVKDHPTGTPMHSFGVESLLQLHDQLVELPETCSLLLQTSTLQDTVVLQRAQEGVARLRGGAAEPNGHDEFDLPNGSADDAGSRGFRSLHADPPSTDGHFQDPDSKSQEKILFVINNLSKENMESKLADMREVLKPMHYQWFAAYLVEQRARLEQNNQAMYYEFLSRLNDPTLLREVLRETYVSIVKMMSARSTLENGSDRGHLKALGAWLGSMTLAQDKPIKHRNIYFVDMLLEGFESQRLIIVIPFTCKVLVQGARSVVFKPPNPWLMEIIQVLIELYHFADLKLNQKFEIEVLCKDMGLEHTDVVASTVIRDSQAQLDEVLTNASGIDHLDEYDLRLQGGRLHETFSVAEIMQSLPDLEQVLRYPPPSGAPADQAAVKETITKAVRRAIEEIIAPVVERSITIASLSTSQLVSKDYSIEASPEKFSSAAREMVKSLAGSLALVTCKEPLRMSITSYIRAHLEEYGASFMAEGTILMTVNDNLDIAASMIKEAAEQRAVPEMDQVISEELEERRRFMAENPNGEFFGQNLNRWATWIPEPYKMIPGGLNEAQRAVYEDFERRVHGMNTGHVQNASTDSTGRQLPDILNESLAMPNLSTPSGQPALPHQSPLTQHESRANSTMPQQRMNGIPDSIPPHERIALMIDEIQKATRTSPVTSLKDLDKDSPIFQDIRQILIILSSAHGPALDHVARQVAEKITTAVLRQPPQNAFEAEFLAFLLNKLCTISENIVREVMRWITANEEALLGNSWITAAFVQVGLMEFARVDSVISQALRDHSELGLRLLHDLMNQTLFNEEPAALRADFVNSIVALYAWLQNDPEHEVLLDISNKLKAHGIPEYAVTAVSDKTKAKEDQMRYVFKEWSGLYENSAYNEATFVGFLRDVHRSQLINSAEDLVTFLRLAIEASVEAFDIEANSFRGSFVAAFNRTDALALLIILLVKFQGEENGAVKLSKAAYFNQILSLTVLLVNNHIEVRGVAFNQRVFTRLYCSILANYAEFRLEETPEHTQLMHVFARTLGALQPMLMPAFAFGWITLVCHRVFVEGMLRSREKDLALQYRELVGIMLQYPLPLMEMPRLQPTAEALMKGIWRNMFVLHSDFPDFICENHVYLCARASIREPAIRNLILAAQPSSLTEPDPLTPNLRVERIEEMKRAPTIATDYAQPLHDEGLVESLTQALNKSSELDIFVKNFTELLSVEEKNQVSFRNPAHDAEILESLVVFLVQHLLSNSSSTSGLKFDPNSTSIQLLGKLLADLEPRQKYLLTTSMFDQLRYPNMHTEYYCKVVLHIWGTNSTAASEEQPYIREIMIRVLRERIDGLRPIPWGAIVVFKELSENSNYGFWDTQPFVNEPELRQRMMVAAKGHY